ncbi:hypothetical protein L0P54_01900 [Anaerosalibacter bizertensis]|uniref:Uncharacterized protein n=1 Tax=Anaerosalibacter bizertensis TaxID=932217 RepID=A0A9Q4ABW0_9FIRM|nr:CBO2463/CBO2479 domain-containing protein [Anaerosalibacter bizertensis]MBV1818402.1 hypothetical protein [Bacteroidales bacterium MSK.15.36]HHV26463.1 hypothetical protein [Tissierellia bacterium]MBU5293967.1 hypothetical protein [Anaerosalibacter bizertensis]MCB5559503.1 hypothetical protein [Anaerosalibacter bizertensis]MCG4564554.1 hypothetical protein [Anaerosalibacter bizertensis]
MEKLRYISSERYYEGIIIEVSDGGVVIDFKGRMGQIRLPKRMVISKNELKEGQEVGFLLTYPEVIDENINENYIYGKRQLNKRMNRGSKL